ncbi:carboxylesterase family protein [Hymenobacter sp. B81]|uniref:carboxylesterase family protein n=1 Tax=Hymenobacter sp. B81 TaxID=3344878 RepID=UPI0037DCAE39
MKQLLLTAFGLLLLLSSASAQIDTTAGRYLRPVFPQVSVVRDVEYGAAVNSAGTNQILRLDLYQPQGDTVRRRPLVVLAHEGAFLTGNRNDQFMTELCTRLAQLGYVAVSIDYRVGFFPFDSVNVGRAALRAAQDMRAAVRFFRRDAATARQYRIHPGYIFAGGSSAGAFVALQLGYLDKPAEVPAYVGLAAVGGTLEGQSGNPGYSSAVAAVLNLSGAVGALSWLEPGNVPLLSVHGTADTVVPFLLGKAFGLSTSPRLYGSGALKPRADAVGIPNGLKALAGAGHVPYNGSSPGSVAYFDTTFRAVRDFLRPLLRRPGTVLTQQAPTFWQHVQLYPLPARAAVYLDAGPGFRPSQLTLTDATGRVVRRLFWPQPRLVIERGALPAGIYYLSGPGLPARRLALE